jgi:hypothetical protein
MSIRSSVTLEQTKGAVAFFQRAQLKTPWRSTTSKSRQWNAHANMLMDDTPRTQNWDTGALASDVSQGRRKWVSMVRNEHDSGHFASIKEECKF